MNKSKLDLPHIKKIIAHSLARGSSQRQIAEVLGVSQPTISRIARQADVQEMICHEEKSLIKTTESILEELRADPRFLAVMQKKIEKKLLDF